MRNTTVQRFTSTTELQERYRSKLSLARLPMFLPAAGAKQMDDLAAKGFIVPDTRKERLCEELTCPDCPRQKRERQFVW